MAMAAEDLMEYIVGAEVELLKDVDNAHKQGPQDIPSVSVPHHFSMPEDSSDDDDCGLSRNCGSAYGMHSMELGGECLECGMQFKSSQELIEHFDNYTGKVSTSCNICRVTFSRTTSLAMHLVNAHPIALNCQTCQLYFCSLWDLNKHIGKHLFTNLLKTGTTPEEIFNNGLNGSDEILKRQYTLPSTVALKHDCNSNGNLSDSEVSLQERASLPYTVTLKHENKSKGTEVSLKGQYVLPSTVIIKHEELNNGLNVDEGILNGQCTLPLVALHNDNSNDCFSSREFSLETQHTIHSTVMVKHEETSVDGLNGSKVSSESHNTLISTVTLKHEDKSNNSAITVKHGDASDGGLNVSEGVLIGQNTPDLAVTLDHNYNSTYRLNCTEVTVNGQYSQLSAITLKYGDESNGNLNGSKAILKRPYTLSTSALALDHNYSSRYSICVSEESLERADILPSTVIVKHEELNNGLNVDEGILNGQCTLPLVALHNDNSNDCFSSREFSLETQHTIHSTVMVKHEETSVDGLNGSKVSSESHNTLISTVTLKHEDKSNNSAITVKHGDASDGGLNVSEGVLIGQNTPDLAVTLDHNYNSTYRLNGTEVTVNGQYSQLSAITLKYGDESNGSLNGSKAILKRPYTLSTSALALDHNYSSRYSICVSEESLERADILPSTVMIIHEDQSDNGLNGSEVVSYRQHILPSAVSLKRKDNSGNGVSCSELDFDHTYSIKSNQSVRKRRPRLEAEEMESEDIKPDPSTLIPLLRHRDKLEKDLEEYGAPHYWNELREGLESEHSEDTESVEGTDWDSTTESSGETNITEKDISLSEEKETKSVYGDYSRSDIQSSQEDEDAELLKDQDDASLESEGSEFNPDELSDSGSCSNGCTEPSYTSPVCTRSTKTRSPQTKLCPSKQSKIKHYHCVYCATTGLHHRGLTCTACRVLFQNRKALQNHKSLVHGHSVTMCASCGRGPFVNMVLHLRRCSGVGSVCFKCHVKFPSEKSLENHNIQSHNDLSKTSDDTCAYCGNGPFPSLVVHMRTCAKQKGFKCPVCNIFFMTEPALAVHMVCCHNNPRQAPSKNTQTHDGKGTRVDYEKGLFSSLDVNLGTLSKRKYIQCSVCKFFYSGDALTNHMNSSHGSISQFQGPISVAADQTTCSHCGIGPFTNLDYHLKICCPKNSIQCSICKDSFSVDVLADHMISMHSAKRVCDNQAISQGSVCKNYFSTEDSLVNHMVSAYTDMIVNQAKGPSGQNVPLLPMDVSLTSGQQSPCSPALTCFSTGGKELKLPAPVAGQSPSSVGQMSFAGQSTMSLPRVTLSSTTSSSSITHPAGPVMTTLFFNTPGGPGKMARLVPMVQQMNPPKLKLLSPTQTNKANPPEPLLKFVQQEINQSKSIHQLSARANAQAVDPVKSPITPAYNLVPVPSMDPDRSPIPPTIGPVISPITPAYRLVFVPNMNPVKSTIPPAPRLVSASSMGQITMIQLSPFSAPSPAYNPSVSFPPNTAPLSILFMFVNRSKQLALEKRMTMSWRSKGIYTCRQCGAISRQPSLSVKHRYLHRGSRQYHCHCGRSFLRRMHLLRHYVQHAQATRYICTACGETFDGARCLTQHMVVTDNTTRCPGDSVRLKQKKACRVPFSCHCGQLFCRPAAFLWHKLQNSQRT